MQGRLQQIKLQPPEIYLLCMKVRASIQPPGQVECINKMNEVDNYITLTQELEYLMKHTRVQEYLDLR